MKETPRRSVVSPACEDGEGGMKVVGWCEEGQNGVGGRECGGEKSRTGEKEEESRVQAEKGRGKEVGCDDGKAFNAGRG